MTAPAPGPGVSAKAPAPSPKRYLALDAYRGFIMIFLASNGFGFGALRSDPFWGSVAPWFDHVPWEGCVFWDLIQPAFMFMVGVAMPFALASRAERGAAFGDNLRHVAVRAFRLVLLSQVLISVSGNKLSFQLINVLSQIAFTYFLCFWIMQLRQSRQVIAAALILAGHWALFAIFPGPEGPFSKAGNVGEAIDLAVLGHTYGGNYVTINFLSSTVTTLFGVWAGQLLMGGRTHGEKLRILAVSMVLAFAGGLALTPWNPMVKRIWTASFTLYSTGWVLLMLIAFYWVIEVKNRRRWAFPLMVVGMNSIFIYSLGQVLRGWINRSVGVFTFNWEFIGTLAPVAQSLTVTLVMWYCCLWLYRRKIFFKL